MVHSGSLQQAFEAASSLLASLQMGRGVVHVPHSFPLRLVACVGSSLVLSLWDHRRARPRHRVECHVAQPRAGTITISSYRAVRI